MIKTSNKNANEHVHNLEIFKGSNTFSEKVGDLYVVYSYGKHFPMFVFDTKDGIWYENTDKYSSSTSKQQTQLHPLKVTYESGTKDLLKMINNQ